MGVYHLSLVLFYFGDRIRVYLWFREIDEDTTRKLQRIRLHKCKIEIDAQENAHQQFGRAQIKQLQENQITKKTHLGRINRSR